MTHLHVADGVLPWWAAGLALLLAGVAVLVVLRARRGARRVAFLARSGVAGAFLVVAMSLPLGPGVHLSFAPLAGMVLGPAGGFLAAFLANAALASFGHGGITALGVNGLFVGTQAVLGAALFGLLRRPLGARAGAAGAAAATLLLAAAAGILALQALPVGGGMHDHDHDHEGSAWGLWLVGGLSVAAAAVEAGLTGATVAFLARVRADLVPGGAPA